MLNAIIIEDEERSQKVLMNLLKLACPDVSLLGLADSVTSGLRLVKETSPDLVFLDIQLKDESGFSILEQLDRHVPDVIFTTAYDQYAIKAFQFSALDYLMKPIDIEELKRAVEKCKSKKHIEFSRNQIKALIHNLNISSNEAPLLSVSTSDLIEYVRINQIVRCEAHGAYCQIYLKNGRKIMISKVIKELELLLSDHNFYRIHQTHLINLSEITQYVKNINSIKMSDQSSLPLARSRKEGFFKVLNHLKI